MLTPTKYVYCHHFGFSKNLDPGANFSVSFSFYMVSFK